MMMVMVRWATARQDMTTTMMATGDDDNDVDGDCAKCNEVNDDGDGAKGKVNNDGKDATGNKVDDDDDCATGNDNNDNEMATATAQWAAA